MSREILAVKIIGGEVIMGFVTDKPFSKHLLVEETQELLCEIRDGKMEVELAPWLPFAMKYDFSIPKSSVVTTFKVRPNLEINYKKNTGNK